MKIMVEADAISWVWTWNEEMHMWECVQYVNGQRFNRVTAYDQANLIGVTEIIRGLGPNM